MRNRLLPIAFVLITIAVFAVGVIYYNEHALDSTPQGLPSTEPTASTTPSATVGTDTSPTPSGSPGALASPGIEVSPGPVPSSNPSPDLSASENGLSKATVILTTSKGVIKYKLYPQDAPNTVKRMVELMSQGFYTNLIWHRVKPGFVVQGGDPQGTGTGGSGQKLKAEFNNRRHIEGSVAMARGGDPDSADSQFYICLGTFPHLDHSYTVFGQVIEGIDVARKLQVGDKIYSMVVQ